MSIRIDEPDSFLIRQGDEGKECFFFLCGEVAVFVKSNDMDNSSFSPTIQSGLFQSNNADENNFNIPTDSIMIAKDGISIPLMVSDGDSELPDISTNNSNAIKNNITVTLNQPQTSSKIDKIDINDILSSHLTPREHTARSEIKTASGITLKNVNGLFSPRTDVEEILQAVQNDQISNANQGSIEPLQCFNGASSVGDTYESGVPDMASFNANGNVKFKPLSNSEIQEKYNQYGRLVSILKVGDSCGERSIQQQCLTAATCISISRVASLVLTRSKFNDLIKAQLQKKNQEKEQFFKSCLPSGRDSSRLITRMVQNADVVKDLYLPRGAKLLAYGSDQQGSIGRGGSFIVPPTSANHAHEDPSASGASKLHQSTIPAYVAAHSKARQIYFLVEGRVAIRAPVRMGCVSNSAERAALRRVQKAPSLHGIPPDVEEISIRSSDQMTTIALLERGGFLGYASGLLGIREPFDLVIDSKQAKFYVLRVHDLTVKFPIATILWMMKISTENLERYVQRQLDRLDATQHVLKEQCMSIFTYNSNLWSSPFLKRKIEDAQKALHDSPQHSSSFFDLVEGFGAKRDDTNVAAYGSLSKDFASSNVNSTNIHIENKTNSTTANLDNLNDQPKNSNINSNTLTVEPGKRQLQRSNSANSVTSSSKRSVNSSARKLNRPSSASNFLSTPQRENNFSSSSRNKKQNGSLSIQGHPTSNDSGGDSLQEFGGMSSTFVDSNTYYKDFLQRMTTQKNYFVGWCPPNTTPPTEILMGMQNGNHNISTSANSTMKSKTGDIFPQIGIQSPTKATDALINSKWADSYQISQIPNSQSSPTPLSPVRPNSASRMAYQLIKDTTAGQERLGSVSIIPPSTTRTLSYVNSLVLPAMAAHAAIDSRVIDSSYVVSSNLPMSINGNPSNKSPPTFATNMSTLKNQTSASKIKFLAATTSPSLTKLSSQQKLETGSVPQYTYHRPEDNSTNKNSNPSNTENDANISNTNSFSTKTSPSFQQNSTPQTSNSFSHGISTDLRNTFDFKNGRVDPFLPPHDSTFGSSWKTAHVLSGNIRGFKLLSPAAQRRVLMAEGRKQLKFESDRTMGKSLLVAAGLSRNEIDNVVKLRDAKLLNEVQRLSCDPRLAPLSLKSFADHTIPANISYNQKVGLGNGNQMNNSSSTFKNQLNNSNNIDKNLMSSVTTNDVA